MDIADRYFSIRGRACEKKTRQKEQRKEQREGGGKGEGGTGRKRERRGGEREKVMESHIDMRAWQGGEVKNCNL